MPIITVLIIMAWHFWHWHKAGVGVVLPPLEDRSQWLRSFSLKERKRVFFYDYS
jgi:hypothetical protein